MGLAIAARLLELGFGVDVWNRSQKNLDELEAAGATQVGLDQALQNHLVISMLSNDAAALDFFDSATLQKMSPNTIHVCMSTLSPRASKELAARHQAQDKGFVSAPVLGRPAAVTSGKLLIVAAGQTDQIAKASAIFNKLSAKWWNVGEDHASSLLVKLGVNYNIIHALQAIAESVALVEAGGVDPNTFVEIITHTAFTGSAYTGYGPMIVNRQYTPPGFTVELGLKDMRLIEEAAKDLDLTLPVSSVLTGLFETALADSKLKDLDWSAIAELTRRA